MLAVALYPTFDRLAKLGGRRRLLPLRWIKSPPFSSYWVPTWVALSLVESSLVRHIEAGELSPAPPIASVKSWPLIGEQLRDRLELAHKLRVARPKGHASIETAWRQRSAPPAPRVRAFSRSCRDVTRDFCPPDRPVDGRESVCPKDHRARENEFVELAGAIIRKVSRGVIGCRAAISLAGSGC